MQVEAFLYDAGGHDRRVELHENILSELNDKQLLWINLLERKRETLERVISTLQLKDVPVQTILNISERPKLDKFEQFYRFFIVSVEYDEKDNLTLIPIDFIVGRNYVITIHNGLVNYYREFIEHETGETQIGELDTESFVVSLLDLHIVTYFRALENIEREVDRLDDKILKKDLEDDEFLAAIVNLRGDVSRLRRWFLPHRDVFYALARPDFKTVTTDAESLATFQLLNEHFETCAAAIESSRDTVLSLFDLHATKTSHRMNFLIRRLTFITLLVGGMGVVAGILGMNFEEEFFKNPLGFWVAIGLMLSLAGLLIILGYKKRWI